MSPRYPFPHHMINTYHCGVAIFISLSDSNIVTKPALFTFNHGSFTIGVYKKFKYKSIHTCIKSLCMKQHTLCDNGLLVITKPTAIFIDNRGCGALFFGRRRVFTLWRSTIFFTGRWIRLSRWRWWWGLLIVLLLLFYI